jgi:hypothetical protein
MNRHLNNEGQCKTGHDKRRVHEEGKGGWNIVDVFSIHVWIWNTETYRSHFKKEGGEWGNNGGDEPYWGALYTYLAMSQQSPLYNYYILIESFYIKFLKNYIIFDQANHY